MPVWGWIVVAWLVGAALLAALVAVTVRLRERHEGTPPAEHPRGRRTERWSETG